MIEYKMKNLVSLVQDMENTGYVIDIFEFKFNKNDYYVVVQRNPNKTKREKYWLAYLEFIKKEDIHQSIKGYATYQTIMFYEPKKFYPFFNIGYNKGEENIFSIFARELNKYSPIIINPKNYGLEEKSIVVKRLSVKDKGDNPNKIYITNVKHNVKNGILYERTCYNDNKARLLVSDYLYNKFKDDPYISFCFSEDKTKLSTDEEVIEKFIKNREKYKGEIYGFKKQ